MKERLRRGIHHIARDTQRNNEFIKIQKNQIHIMLMSFNALMKFFGSYKMWMKNLQSAYIIIYKDLKQLSVRFDAENPLKLSKISINNEYIKQFQ